MGEKPKKIKQFFEKGRTALQKVVKFIEPINLILTFAVSLILIWSFFVIYPKEIAPLLTEAEIEAVFFSEEPFKFKSEADLSELQRLSIYAINVGEYSPDFWQVYIAFNKQIKIENYSEENWVKAKSNEFRFVSNQRIFGEGSTGFLLIDEKSPDSIGWFDIAIPKPNEENFLVGLVMTTGERTKLEAVEVYFDYQSGKFVHIKLSLEKDPKKRYKTIDESFHRLNLDPIGHMKRSDFINSF